MADGSQGQSSQPRAREWGWRLGRRKQWHRVGAGRSDKEAVNGTQCYQLLPSRSPVTASTSVPGEQINDGKAVAACGHLCQHWHAATWPQWV